jgi:hypothetical protein
MIFAAGVLGRPAVGSCGPLDGNLPRATDARRFLVREAVKRKMQAAPAARAIITPKRVRPRCFGGLGPIS